MSNPTDERVARLRAAADEDVADIAAERRARSRARDGWSIEDSLGAMERFTNAALGHVEDGYGSAEELTRIRALREEMRQVEDVLIARLLSEGYYSYADIGRLYGITKQAVAKRFPGMSGRRAGGQPSTLR